MTSISPTLRIHSKITINSNSFLSQSYTFQILVLVKKVVKWDVASTQIDAEPWILLFLFHIYYVSILAFITTMQASCYILDGRPLFPGDRCFIVSFLFTIIYYLKYPQSVLRRLMLSINVINFNTNWAFMFLFHEKIHAKICYLNGAIISFDEYNYFLKKLFLLLCIVYKVK